MCSGEWNLMIEQENRRRRWYDYYVRINVVTVDLLYALRELHIISNGEFIEAALRSEIRQMSAVRFIKHDLPENEPPIGKASPL